MKVFPKIAKLMGYDVLPVTKEEQPVAAPVTEAVAAKPKTKPTVKVLNAMELRAKGEKEALFSGKEYSLLRPIMNLLNRLGFFRKGSAQDLQDKADALVGSYTAAVAAEGNTPASPAKVDAEALKAFYEAFQARVEKLGKDKHFALNSFGKGVTSTQERALISQGLAARSDRRQNSADVTKVIDQVVVNGILGIKAGTFAAKASEKDLSAQEILRRVEQAQSDLVAFAVSDDAISLMDAPLASLKQSLVDSGDRKADESPEALAALQKQIQQEIANIDARLLILEPNAKIEGTLASKANALHANDVKKHQAELLEKNQALRSRVASVLVAVNNQISRAGAAGETLSKLTLETRQNLQEMVKSGNFKGLEALISKLETQLFDSEEGKAAQKAVKIESPRSVVEALKKDVLAYRKMVAEKKALLKVRSSETTTARAELPKLLAEKTRLETLLKKSEIYDQESVSIENAEKHNQLLNEAADERFAIASKKFAQEQTAYASRGWFSGLKAPVAPQREEVLELFVERTVKAEETLRGEAQRRLEEVKKAEQDVISALTAE